MKDVKEYSVQGIDWDSNSEYLKFYKVGKHSSSTKIITGNNYYCIISGTCLPAIHIEIHQNRLPNPSGQTSFITGINFAISFRVC